DFLSIASHELRTPLTTLQLQIESLLRNLRDRPGDGLPLGRIEKNAQKARAQLESLVILVEGLLDVSRIAGGNLELVVEEVDLPHLVAATCARLGPVLAASECRLDHSIEPGMTGLFDRLRLERVLSNLVSNAAKYGRGKPVDVTLVRGDGTARVVVRDR